MVDDLDAVAHRHEHRVAAAAVGADAQAPGAGDLHGRAHLGLGHRRELRRPGRGAQVPREIQLEQVDAFAREEPADASDGVGAVGHPAEGRRLVVGQMQEIAVAEPAGHRDLGAVGEGPRPGEPSRVDLALQHHVEARLGRGRRQRARVARVEHRARVADGGEEMLLGRQAGQLVGDDVREAQVGVRLDQARHQGRAASVDDAVGGWPRHPAKGSRPVPSRTRTLVMRQLVMSAGF